MASAVLEVQKAIVAALKASAGVGALIGDRIYDEPPQDATFPFAIIGRMVETPAIETNDAEGFEVFVTIETWSQKHGTVEAKQIMAAIRAALHLQSLTLDTLTTVFIAEIDATADRFGDGVRAWGRQRYRVLVDN